MSKKAETDQDFQHWLRDIETVAKIGRWEVDLIKKTANWTEGVFKIFEIEDEEILSLDKHISLYIEEHQSLVENAFKNAIESGEDLEYEARINSASENQKWVRVLGYHFKKEMLIGTIQDITEKKINEFHLHQLIDNTEESFLLINKDFTIKTFNKQFKTRYKKHFNKDIRVGESILSYTLDDRVEMIKSIYEDVFRGETRSSVLEINNEDSENRHVFEMHYKPTRDNENEITGAFVSIKDITEQQISKKRIEESEKRFRALVENGTDGTAILDEKGSVKYITPSIQGMLGYTMDEIYSANLFEITHPDDVPLVQAKVVDSINKPGESIPGALARLRHKDGSWRWFEAVITNLLHDPLINGIVDNFRDVTDRVEAENRLQKALQKLQKHLENSPLGIIEYDSNLVITKWSKKCEEIFGWSEEEIVSKNTTAFDLVYDEDLENVSQVAKELSSGVGAGNISVNRNYTKSGKIVDCIWYNSTIKDHSGNTETIMSLVQDITKSVEADKRLQKSIKEKTVMLAEIHHRVKNNLAIVSGLLELQAFKSNNEALMNGLFDSVNRIKSIALVHEHLYNTSDFGSIRIDKNIQKLVENLSLFLNVKNEVKIEFDLEAIELNINQAVPCALFMNEAVSNAYKHAFKEMTNRNGLLKIACQQKEDEIIFEVEDNGGGFDYNKYKSKIGVKSLGLQLLEMLTEQLNGVMKIESKKGTKVSISFPKYGKEKGSSATEMDFN